MRPTCLIALLALSLAGCKTCCTEDASCGHESVIKVPQQRVVVETPAATGVAAPTGVAPVTGVPAPIGAGLPVAPVGMPMPIGAPANVSVQNHTGIGFVFDHINIPIPFPKLIAVPKPTEVTYQVPPSGIGYGYGAPVGMPMGMPIGMPCAMPAAGLMAPPTGFVAAPPPAPQPTGLTPQQQAALLQLLASQPTGAPAPPPAPVGAAPAPAPMVVTDQQCEEIIEKCNILKRLHQLRQHACDAACPVK